MFRYSDYLILVLALIAFAGSILLWIIGNPQEGLFVGIWVPSILSFGIYRKVFVVSQATKDRELVEECPEH
jgi:hypothetical protein